MSDFKNVGAAAAASGEDFNKTTKGGGGNGPRVPAAGPTRLRFVAYVEVGVHEKVFKGIPEDQDLAMLTFELSGKNHPPRDIDGKKVPWLLTITEKRSRNEKANLSKLFKAMNYDGKHAHFAQMLGDAFAGEVFHRKFPKRGEDRSKPETWTGVDAELRKKGEAYSIRAPKALDPATDEYVTLEVAPAISPLRCFVWAMPDKQQWDSLFIEGEYPEVKDDNGVVVKPARSKNFLQEKIKAAKNFTGSPVQALLGGVQATDLGGVEQPADDTDDDIPF